MENNNLTESLELKEIAAKILIFVATVLGVVLLFVGVMSGLFNEYEYVYNVPLIVIGILLMVPVIMYVVYWSLDR